MRMETDTKVRAAVAGASGYAGGEVLRLLLGHPSVEIGALTAGSNAGEPLTKLQPHLLPLSDRILEETTVDVLSGHDVVFLALPHGQSAEIANALPDETVVIDCGADFRLTDADEWERYYGGPHAGSWPYGLPELGTQRSHLAGATRIAVPGCYPTVSTLALAPAVAAGIVDPGDIVVVAASGTSGAGKALKPNLLGSEVIGSAGAYGVGGVHRHTPEIKQNLSLLSDERVSVSFTPMLVPMPRGILATVTARPTGTAAVREVLAEAYQDEPFVRVLPEGAWPHTAATLGADTCLLQATVDGDSGRIVVVSALDNLGKGAAGQAVQCANLMLGLDETAGLSVNGMAP